MKLYFGNSTGPKREIADCANAQEVGQAIQKFVDDCNARKPAQASPFVIYYTRVWREGAYIKYDVGSYSEFFYLETEKEVPELYDR